MLVYGMQVPLTKVYEDVNISELFFSSELSESNHLLIAEGKIRFIVVDHRLTTAIPPGGVYFELAEPDARKHKAPISSDALQKFDYINNIDRIFDSGNIVIYDTSKLYNAP